MCQSNAMVWKVVALQNPYVKILTPKESDIKSRGLWKVIRSW